MHILEMHTSILVKNLISKMAEPEQPLQQQKNKYQYLQPGIREESLADPREKRFLQKNRYGIQG